LAKAFGVALQQ